MSTTLIGLPLESGNIQDNTDSINLEKIDMPPASSFLVEEEVTDDDIANADLAKRHLAILGNEYVEMRSVPRN